jgi:carboxypeptidase Taq
MTNTNNLYKRYKSKLQRIADVRYAAAVLQWDQETYLPAKGAESRARQLATLSEMAHQLFTDRTLGKLLTDLNASTSLNETERKNVELTFEEYEKQQKFTSAFVRKMSEAVSKAFYNWVEARKQNDFKVFQPALEALVKLKKEEANILGYTGHPYNALLNEFEKGATVTMLDAAFDKVLTPLSELLKEMSGKLQFQRDFFHQHFPKEQQWEWGMYLVKELGFDLEAGRQDISEHPFTTSFSPKDVRITTRINEEDFANMTWSCIHEVGHALYEQGLPVEDYGLPSGEFASLSIHESQSRLWENCVGRNVPFWTHYLQQLKRFFPKQLEKISVEQFVGAITRVEPSLIRTEADELTYHFHVYIRYSLEKRLIDGSLAVKDIPAAWSEMYEKYLGVQVPDDKQGCLQDVHWSHGSFGYFPTYSLGSFYAAQFWQQAKSEIENLEDNISHGETHELLNWLREKIHRHGKTYTSEELCTLVTGKGLDSNLFIEYLRNKFLN